MLELQAVRNVNKNYGARKTNGTLGGRVDTDSVIKFALWTINFDEFNVTPSLSNMEHVIPAGSTVLNARLRIVEAVTSTSTTTDLQFGLREKDGTTISTNGLIQASVATQTAIAVQGDILTGTGSLLGGTIGAADGELIATSTAADLLTGRVELFVEYMTPAALPAA